MVENIVIKSHKQQFAVILLSKVDKMEYFFTFTITRTVITLDPNQPVDTETITTDPIRVDENDQTSMREFFDGVVNQDFPPGIDLVNYADPQLFNALHGIQPLAGIYNLDRTSVEGFIHNVRPTYRHPGPIFRTHFAFVINVVIRQRANSAVK